MSLKIAFVKKYFGANLDFSSIRDKSDRDKLLSKLSS